MLNFYKINIIKHYFMIGKVNICKIKIMVKIRNLMCKKKFPSNHGEVSVMYIGISFVKQEQAAITRAQEISVT